jgi:hypothetical protein
VRQNKNELFCKKTFNKIDRKKNIIVLETKVSRPEHGRQQKIKIISIAPQ